MMKVKMLAMIWTEVQISQIWLTTKTMMMTSKTLLISAKEQIIKTKIYRIRLFNPQSAERNG